jgi:hypothetical protein
VREIGGRGGGEEEKEGVLTIQASNNSVGTKNITRAKMPKNK